MKYRSRSARKAHKSTGRNSSRSLRSKQHNLGFGETLEVRLALSGNTASAWQNQALATDVNNDGHVSTSDAISIINELNAHGAHSLAGKASAGVARMALMVSGGEDNSKFLDVNGDSMVSASDAISVINALTPQSGETAKFRVVTTDLNGNVITSIGVGEKFQIRVFVDDLRTDNDPQGGVFSAAMDVTYSNATLVDVADPGNTEDADGVDEADDNDPVVFSDAFSQGRSADISTPGEIKDAYAFSSSLAAPGAAEQLFFVATYTAGNSAGTATFGLNPSDSQGLDTTVYGSNDAIPSGDIAFEGAQLTIVDVVPKVSITGSAAEEVNTGATSTMQFTVKLSEPTSETVKVNYSITPGTATAGSDYTDVSGVLEFGPHETEKTISVEILGDTIYEANEQFTVVLATPEKGVLDESAKTALGTIVENDTPPKLSIDDVTVNEATSTATLHVTLDAPSTLAIDVNFTTAGQSALGGSDFTDKSGSLTFAPGETSKDIVISILNDALDEENESLNVTLNVQSNANDVGVADSEGTITITDDDSQPTMSVNSPTVTEGDSTQTLTFTITLSSASSKTVTANYVTANDTAVMGTDFQFTSGSLTFAPGETSKTVAVTIIGDLTKEETEKFFFGIGDVVNATGPTSNATGTITDDDFVGKSVPATVSGRVYNDSNDNRTIDANEKGIGGVAITLTGTDISGKAVSLSTTTDTEGNYKFINVLPGTYEITELAQPNGYFDGHETVGSHGGTTSENVGLDKFFLSFGASATPQTVSGYNFGEFGKTAAASGGTGARTGFFVP